MLHVRLTAPAAMAESALERIDDDPTVVNVVVLRGVTRSGDGHLVMFDLARENANAVLGDLRRLGVEREGAITVDESEVVLSDAADLAERRAPGEPVDAVIWDAVEERATSDARLTWSFLAFLTLASMLASIGRYLDQPILIIGAMVVGPEFAPVAALCVGLARRRWSLLAPAVATLSLSITIAAALTFVPWLVARGAGLVDPVAATSGPQTEFIVAPDVWSFVVAVLAGVAGVLSLTASKSSTLVGVFISVTTVPAIGTFALTLAVGALDEAASALVQLGVNLAGLVLAGTATLLVQSVIWRSRKPGGAAQPGPAPGGSG